MTVTGYDSQPKTTRPSARGILNPLMRTPELAMMTAAAICPKNLTPGRRDWASSITPTATMTVMPIITPIMLTPLPWAKENGPGQTCASSKMYSTAKAAKSPVYMATPPMRGIGSLLTRRAPGWSTTPCLMANERTKGTAATVTAKATKNNMR